MAIEICDKEELLHTISIATEIVKNENTFEVFFIYEADDNSWYSLQRKNDSVFLSPNSLFGNLNLKQITDMNLAVV